MCTACYSVHKLEISPTKFYFILAGKIYKLYFVMLMRYIYMKMSIKMVTKCVYVKMGIKLNFVMMMRCIYMKVANNIPGHIEELGRNGIISQKIQYGI